VIVTVPQLEQPRTESVSVCPVCNSPEAVLKVSLPDHLHGVLGTYSYVRCVTCKTVYQNPRVIEEDLQLCYPQDCFTHQLPKEAPIREIQAGRSVRDTLRRAIRHYADQTSRDGLPRWACILGRALARVQFMRVRARFGLMDALSTPAAVPQTCLEVGPGQGQTLRNLRAIGWSTIGLDTDPEAARTAAAISGCEVRVGTLVGADLPASSFDLVFMSHVVEHLPDLRPSLDRAFALLTPGGRLVMLYPNPESLGTIYDPQFSCNWDAPRHLVLPPPLSMADLLKSVGFVSIDVSTPAKNAACYRNRARKYRAQAAHYDGFVDRTTFADRFFGLLESMCVFAGAAVGEEILVVARKENSTPRPL
jgi:SAM-dependent methyltransferase